MDTKLNNFEPTSDLIQEDDCDTLILYLPGFSKEQLRVQLTSTRVLRISGTKPTGENRWISFQKDFPVSTNCDTNKILAKFEKGRLYVRQPKLIIPAVPKEPTREAQQQPTDQRQADGMTAALDDRRTGVVKDSTEKSKEQDERKQDQEKITNGAKMADKATKKDQATGKLNPAAKPMMSRQMMTMAVTVLFAFLIGMYVSNRSLFTKKTEN